MAGYEATMEIFNVLDMMYERALLEKSDPSCEQIVHNSVYAQQIGNDLVLLSPISTDNPVTYYYLIYNSYELFTAVTNEHREAYLFYKMRSHYYDGTRSIV